MALQTVKSGGSLLSDTLAAIGDLHQQIVQPDMALVVFHCSNAYDLDVLARAIPDLFGSVPVIGCTSAGEIGLNGYQSGGMVGYSLSRSMANVAVCDLPDLVHFSVQAAHDAVKQEHDRLTAQEGPLDFTNAFALMLIDGLSRREEMVSRAIHSGLGMVPLVGGSAGDDMRFQQTSVYYDGRFASNRVVMALVHCKAPFKTFKSQHFVRTEERIVVTQSTPELRLISEINGLPAVDEYARAVGMTKFDLSPMVFAAHPVLVRVGGAEYIRSIQQVTPEGNLAFYCAIDTGIVLTVAKGIDLVDNLEQTLNEIAQQIGPPQLVIGCDCILRHLECQQKNLTERMSELLRRYHVIGFSTYGEQFNGMHVNQTFTGIAIGSSL